MRKSIAVGAVLLALGACAVQEERKGEEITIEHAANQFFVAEMKAEDYCNASGRRAVHVQTKPRQASLLLFESSVSVFRCVVPKPAK